MSRFLFPEERFTQIATQGVVMRSRGYPEEDFVIRRSHHCEPVATDKVLKWIGMVSRPILHLRSLTTHILEARARTGLYAVHIVIGNLWPNPSSLLSLHPNKWTCPFSNSTKAFACHRKRHKTIRLYPHYASAQARHRLHVMGMA